jgi:hypothetical protein
MNRMHGEKERFGGALLQPASLDHRHSHPEHSLVAAKQLHIFFTFLFIVTIGTSSRTCIKLLISWYRIVEQGESLTICCRSGCRSGFFFITVRYCVVGFVIAIYAPMIYTASA